MTSGPPKDMLCLETKVVLTHWHQNLLGMVGGQEGGITRR